VVVLPCQPSSHPWVQERLYLMCAVRYNRHNRPILDLFKFIQ